MTETCYQNLISESTKTVWFSFSKLTMRSNNEVRTVASVSIDSAPHPEWSWYRWRRRPCRCVWWTWTSRLRRRQRTRPCRCGLEVRWVHTGRRTWVRYCYRYLCRYRPVYRYWPAVSAAGPSATHGRRDAARDGATAAGRDTSPCTGLLYSVKMECTQCQ